jgi:hypothetical protein
MEPTHRIPIKAFPNNAAMIKVEIKQSQNRVINTFLINFKRWILFLFHFLYPDARFMDEVALMKSVLGAFKMRCRAPVERRGLGHKRNVCGHFPRNLGADGAERNFAFGHGFDGHRTACER